MKISELLMMVFVIGLFTTGYIGFSGMLVGTAMPSFNNTTDTSTTSSYLHSMYNTVNASQSQTPSNTQNIVAFAPYNLLTGAFSAVMTALNLPAFFYNMITELTTMLGLPLYVGQALDAIILIIIISAILYLIIGRQF